MKLYFKTLILLTLLLIKAELSAQENNIFEKHQNLYISFGAGSSILGQLPEDIYFDGSNNLQLGVMYERAFHKRFSWIIGLEFERASYNINADVDFISADMLNLVQAGNEKKYTSIRQNNITIPIQGRFYFLENYNAASRNMFLQGGLRLVQSLAFVSDDFGTTYHFRSNGENTQISLSDFSNQRTFQMELMIGFKGQFFKKFDLLNASTLGFIYQFTSIFKNGSTEVYPVHFTWRFLF